MKCAKRCRSALITAFIVGTIFSVSVSLGVEKSDVPESQGTTADLPSASKPAVLDASTQKSLEEARRILLNRKQPIEKVPQRSIWSRIFTKKVQIELFLIVFATFLIRYWKKK